MKISIITVFPEIYESFVNTSLIARAKDEKLIEFNFVRLSDMCKPKERIDEPTCGPGVGMIIKPEVIEKAINACQEKWGDGFKIFFTPQGKKLDQGLLKAFADKFFDSTLRQAQGERDTSSNKISHLILVCARYEGVDARVEQKLADEKLSIGDYVLMGGDLPAQVFLEGLLRFMPGVVGKMESVEKESFSGAFLDYPQFGLPVEWNGLKIPEIVRSGNHAAIEEWRKKQAAKITVQNRFDWFSSSNPKTEDIKLVKEFIPNHYVALMHTQVKVKKGKAGNTSIASLDIHDISRSSATYGIENYFIVTQFLDQQKILNIFLDFWRSEEGKKYNINRFEAVNRVIPAVNLDAVVAKIKEKEGVEPLIVTTSARAENVEETKYIDFFSQSKVWKKERPVLLVFGTGQGLADEVLQKSDFLLLPVEGMTDYNHLSVRSAVAIILDRWLGLNCKNEAKIVEKESE